jgi:Flp pilus assembly protein TadB
VTPLAAVAQLPVLLVIGVIVMLSAACAACAAILDLDLARLRPARERRIPLLEREKDMAAGLGWPWQRWLALRLSFIALGLVVAWLTGVTLLWLIGPVTGAVGLRFALAGRAASRRLRMERAFLGQLRNLRDRMAVSNQSLDTALQELGRNPGPDLGHVLAPLARGGSTIANIVEMGVRARSPIVEQAAAVLIWARSRSTDFLIQTIDTVLVPVGEAELAIQEESMVTLAQQRAVTFAMSSLIVVMLAIALSVDTLRAYYQSFSGQVVLVIVALLFAGLVVLLGLIVRPQSWTRWNLQRLADEQERLGG